ncbi:hypothetical protein F5Y00DRAFT_263634 [Daldinia vernicosa]|uniref:uncharacterized protein n=1 Tax=Daldinia vernicosa TaxID=114800 RepID=UPI002007CD81|nr:uncharacterized protein F5Y00DRAFT_263634 [Daldinia vernicosa]KAI0847484.1 hypothetical protein F5Y00DRAFT_263634 [Daldinia vernicosa]
MVEVGVVPPPEGVTPDFYSRTSVQNSIIIVFGVTFTLATISLILRLYTAFGIVRKLDWDILLIVAAWGTTLAFFIGTLTVAMPAGFGRHLWDITPTQMLEYYNILSFIALTYIWPPSLTKLALLVLYIRLNPSKLFRACVFVSGFLISAYTITFTVLFLGPCNPLSVGTGTCLNDVAISQAVLNIFFDVVIILLPIPMVHNLHLPLKQRAAIGFLIALGSAVVIVSIARVAYVRAMIADDDMTWTQGSAAILSTLELNIGIIGNCVSRLKPLVQKHAPSWVNSLGGSGVGAYALNQSGNVPRSWGTSKGNQGYKLESMERGKKFGNGERGVDKDIYVINDYSVEYDTKESNQAGPAGTGSTDSILAPERDIRRVV